MYNASQYINRSTFFFKSDTDEQLENQECFHAEVIDRKLKVEASVRTDCFTFSTCKIIV